MKLCPKCDGEILPYGKTGALKEIKDGFLISYLLYYCVNCKRVFYVVHDELKIYNLTKTQKLKEIIDGTGKKKKDGS